MLVVPKSVEVHSTGLKSTLENLKGDYRQTNDFETTLISCLN